MSESTQGSDGPVLPVIPLLPVIEGLRRRPAVPPPGTIFSLGWLMAELFDPRRRVSSTVRQPPFDPDVQLPQVSDLGPDPILVFLAAELTELVWWYPKLARQAAAVTGEINKLKATVAAESASVGDAAAAADAADAEAAAADGGVATAAEAAKPTDGGTAFSAAALLTAVSELNQAILDEFADTPERLSAYQLGLALSDLTWLPRKPEPGTQGSAASRPSALISLFSRSQLAATKTLLSGAGSQLPTSAAAIVSQSLDNWADWLDVNASSFTESGADAWSAKADVVLDALRVQGWVWYSVLIADPDVSAAPSMGAWIQAASSIARATAKISGVVPAPVLAAGAARAGGARRAARAGDREPQRGQPGLGVPGDRRGRDQRQRRGHRERGVKRVRRGRVRDLGGRQERRVGLEHHLAAGHDVDRGAAGTPGQPRRGRPANQEEPRSVSRGDDASEPPR